jgi:hypothetical protein
MSQIAAALGTRAIGRARECRVSAPRRRRRKRSPRRTRPHRSIRSRRRSQQLATTLKIVIEPVAMEQPWLSINASIAKGFNDEQLAQLKPLANNITVLNLAGTDVTDKGLEASPPCRIFSGCASSARR